MGHVGNGTEIRKKKRSKIRLRRDPPVGYSQPHGGPDSVKSSHLVIAVVTGN